MDPPNDLPFFVGLYENIQELFPGWKGMVQTVQSHARAVSSGLAAQQQPHHNIGGALAPP